MEGGSGMSDDLVKRLRKRQEFEFIDVYKRVEWEDEDADRIEELKSKLAKAVQIALEECPFEHGTGSYNDWWYDRRTTLAELKGEDRG
jgi:hypothetical protein